MPDEPGMWRLKLFDERFQAWADQEDPSGDLGDVRVRVLNWVVSRVVDPYQGVKADPSIPGLYFGWIPGTQVNGRVVTCSYWINAGSREVVCNMFGTLRPPFI